MSEILPVSIENHKIVPEDAFTDFVNGKIPSWQAAVVNHFIGPAGSRAFISQASSAEQIQIFVDLASHNPRTALFEIYPYDGRNFPESEERYVATIGGKDVVVERLPLTGHRKRGNYGNSQNYETSLIVNPAGGRPYPAVDHISEWQENGSMFMLWGPLHDGAAPVRLTRFKKAQYRKLIAQNEVGSSWYWQEVRKSPGPNRPQRRITRGKPSIDPVEMVDLDNDTSERTPEDFRDEFSYLLKKRFPAVADDGSKWGFQPVVLSTIATSLDSPGEAKILVSSPTGTGKTEMMNQVLYAAGEVCGPRETVIVINHSITGLEQSLDKHDVNLTKQSGAGNSDRNAIRFYTSKQPLRGGGRPIYTTYDSFPKLALFLKENGYHIRLILEDEAHHRLHRHKAVTRALELFPDAIDIQWTATPASRNRHLEALGYRTVFEMNVNDAMRRGTLCPIKFERRITTLERETISQLEGQLSKTGKITDKSIDVMMRDQLYQKTVIDIALNECTVKDHDNNIIRLHPTLIEASSIDQAKILYQSLKTSDRMSDELHNRIGIVTSNQSLEDNEAVLEKFRFGFLDMVVAVDMLTESLDVPRLTHIIKRPTKSVIRGDQVVGRGLRTDPRNPDKVLTVFEVYHTLDAEKAGYRTVPQLFGLSEVVFGSVYRGTKTASDGQVMESPAGYYDKIHEESKGQTYTIVTGRKAITTDIVSQHPEIFAHHGREFTEVFFRDVYPILINNDDYVTPVGVITDRDNDRYGQFRLNREKLWKLIGNIKAVIRLEKAKDQELLNFIHDVEKRAGIWTPYQALESPFQLLAYVRSGNCKTGKYSLSLISGFSTAEIIVRTDSWIEAGLIPEYARILKPDFINLTGLDRYLAAAAAVIEASGSEVVKGRLPIKITEAESLPDVVQYFRMMEKLMTEDIKTWIQTEQAADFSFNLTQSDYRQFLMDHRQDRLINLWHQEMKQVYPHLTVFLDEPKIRAFYTSSMFPDFRDYLLVRIQRQNQGKSARFLEVSGGLSLLGMVPEVRTRLYRLARLTSLQLEILEKFQNNNGTSDTKIARERGVAASDINNIRKTALEKIKAYIVSQNQDQESLHPAVKEFLRLPPEDQKKRLLPLSEKQRQAMRIRYNLDGRYGKVIWRVPWQILEEDVGVPQAAFFSRLHKAQQALINGYSGRTVSMLTLPGGIRLDQLDRDTVRLLLQAAELTDLQADTIWRRLGCHNGRTILSVSELATELKISEVVAINRMNIARKNLAIFTEVNGLTAENLSARLAAGGFIRAEYTVIPGMQLDLMDRGEVLTIMSRAGLPDYQKWALLYRLGLDDGSLKVRDWKTVAALMNNSVVKTVSVWGYLAMEKLRLYAESLSLVNTKQS